MSESRRSDNTSVGRWSLDAAGRGAGALFPVTFIMRAMSEAPKPARPVPSLLSSPPARPDASSAEAVVCERCGSARVYRMHAVWRCADCGFKTDCCGW